MFQKQTAIVSKTKYIAFTLLAFLFCLLTFVKLSLARQVETKKYVSLRAEQSREFNGDGVINSSSLAEIVDSVPPGTFFFVDIDETIIIPDTQFIYGIPQCDDFIQNQLKPKVPPELFQSLTNHMEIAYYEKPVHLVEDEQTMNAIQRLLLKRTQLFAITSRPYDPTLISHLESLGIFFGKYQFNCSVLPYQSGPVHYENGILFVNHSSKGDALIEFLFSRIPNHFREESSNLMREIVFVDDTLDKCVDVMTKLDTALRQSTQLLLTGLSIHHYTASWSLINYQGMLYQFPEILSKALQ